MGLDFILKKFKTQPEEQKMSMDKYVELLQRSGAGGWPNINPNIIERYIDMFRLNKEGAFND
jgi:hypothetical protein